MLLWFADLINVTEEVTIHRPNVSTLRLRFGEPKDPVTKEQRTDAIFILFLAMTVTTNTSDRPNVSLVHD